MHAFNIIASSLSCRANTSKFSKVKSFDPKFITESRLIRIKNNSSCSTSWVYGWPDFLCGTNRSTKYSPTAAFTINRTSAH